MNRFLQTPSSEDFEIIRAALCNSVADGMPEEIRGHVLHAVTAMLPNCQIDGRMIEALVTEVQSARTKADHQSAS